MTANTGLPRELSKAIPVAAGVEREVANCLRVDVATVEAVEALRSAGVRPVLLKGPVIAHWLYPDEPTQRAYNDADLLVAPGALDVAATVLKRLGYRLVPRSGLEFRHGSPHHAECWFRDRDRAAIDLHRTIHGTERLDPALVWDAASVQSGTIDVLGTPIDTPGEAFRLLHLVLHVRPTDRPGSRAWVDLERAVAQIPDDRWRPAADLARRLGVESKVGPILRTTGAGSRLADRLGLSRRWPLYLRLEYRGDDTTAALFVAEILQIRWADRVRLAAEWIAPPPSQLGAQWPLATRGRVGLACVYVLRVALLPWRALRMLRISASTPPDG